MRNIAASFFLLIGTLLAAVGIPLALWLLLAVYQPEEASAWALWALERAQVPNSTSTQLAADLVRRNALIAAAVAAALLWTSAFVALQSAREALRPENLSHDGKGRIEFRARRLRVGGPVEGTIWLTREVEPGEPIQVELSCRRIHGSGANRTTEVAYWDLLEVPATETPVGWSVPFRFNVPPIAPPSGGAGLFGGPGYRWRLAFSRKRSPITFPSVFPLELGPAPDEALHAIERREEAPRRIQAIDEIVWDARKEPVLRKLSDLAAPAPAAPALAPEAPAVSGFVKWALILVLGVPVAVLTVAFATVLVLGLTLR